MRDVNDMPDSPEIHSSHVIRRKLVAGDQDPMMEMACIQANVVATAVNHLYSRKNCCQMMTRLCTHPHVPPGIQRRAGGDDRERDEEHAALEDVYASYELDVNRLHVDLL